MCSVTKLLPTGVKRLKGCKNFEKCTRAICGQYAIFGVLMSEIVFAGGGVGSEVQNVLQLHAKPFSLGSAELRH